MTPSHYRLPTTTFGLHTIETFMFDGEVVWAASALGCAMSYAHGGTRLSTLIRSDWCDDFEEGEDIHYLVGERLAAFKRAFVPCASVSERAAHLLVLTLRGIHRLFLKSDKPERLELRALFEEQILPGAVRAMFDLPKPAPAASPPHPTEAPDDEPVLGRRFVLYAVPPSAPPTREERLADQLDLRKRMFRSNTLRETVRVLHALDEIDDSVRATYEVRATEIALGEELLDLRPAPLEDWYTVRDLARATGMSAEFVGRVITSMGLRGRAGLSRQVVTSAPSDDKTVYSYVYNIRARALILDACGGTPPDWAA